MIKLEHLSKTFEKNRALEDISCEIERGHIYGLVGSNGAGKTTLLRMMSGIILPDHGQVRMTAGEKKADILYVMEEPYFLQGASLMRMADLYRTFYPDFDESYFKELIGCFQLDERKPLGTCSKGIRRQAFAVLALACRPDYLLLDETFDGLDPVMRKKLRRVLGDETVKREMTVVVTSHSLRELEGFCDYLLLLHRGRMVLANDIDCLKMSLMKIQVAYSEPFEKTSFPELHICSFEKSGSVANMIVQGERKQTVNVLKQKKPLLLDILPLSLEEIFLFELEQLGYTSEDFFDTEGGDRT